VNLEIAGQTIGWESEPKVIAEIGINHGGSLEVAKSMVESAIRGGAHFVKHQTHISKLEMSSEAESAIPGNTDKSIFQVISECELEESEEFALMEYTKSLGGIFISTPFSREAADRLNSWGVPAFKIGSGECNNFPLVEHIAKKNKPVLLSTGMNSIDSIRVSAKILDDNKVPYALLHTTNLYPTPHKLLRLGALVEMREAFPGISLGLSDHSTSNSACLASVALGARVLERHYTDSKNREGPDIICSMDETELRDLVRSSSEVFAALGGTKNPATEESVTMNFAFASVSALREINVGETLTRENIFPIRPSGGDFGPSDYESLLGRTVKRRVESRTQIKRADIE
jgi:N-acetylneuraminate synthase